MTTTAATLAQDHAVIKGGQIGGGFNRWTSAWSIYLSKAVPGVKFSSESSTGSAENMRVAGAGQVDFALVFASDLYDGYRGNAPFKSALKDVRALTYVYATVDHFVVPASSSIKTIEDVKGKRVSFGGPGSGSAAMIGQLMQQVGVRDSVTAVYLGSKAPQALANGKIDAFNWSPGLGNATIRNTAAMLKIRFLNLDESARKSGFYKKYPYYGKIIIPGGLYSGVDAGYPDFRHRFDPGRQQKGVRRSRPQGSHSHLLRRGPQRDGWRGGRSVDQGHEQRRGPQLHNGTVASGRREILEGAGQDHPCRFGQPIACGADEGGTYFRPR